MADTTRHDAWHAGEAYEAYMGRWSGRVASAFAGWLDLPAGQDWLDVGCGTGALSATVLATQAPRSLIGVDPSAGFLALARARIDDPRAEFREADAGHLPLPDADRDVAVAGLALNFVPDRAAALAEMRRVVRPDGTVAFYVWDYPGRGVGFMRAFWTAATSLDSAAADLTEDRRFPFCTLPELRTLAERAGLGSVEGTAIEVPTVFADFDDYWRPFTLGAGPAPGYCASLAPDARERLRRALAATLPRRADGAIALTARAWAVRGTVSGPR